MFLTPLDVLALAAAAMGGTLAGLGLACWLLLVWVRREERDR